jgi:hypothetical protein
METIKTSAFVVSVHYGDPRSSARINLKWKGNRGISDFALDRLGEVVNCETESENAGWVVVNTAHPLNNADVVPFSQFGHLIARSSNLVRPGDAIPLRSDDGQRNDGLQGLKRG